jgi:hypothetical protein
MVAADEEEDFPQRIKRDPVACLCFLLVYPHRLDASGGVGRAAALLPATPPSARYDVLGAISSTV